MQYVSLSRLPNQYPTLKNNYVPYKERVVLLNGVYPERNKINFKLPEFKDITPINDTTFRFVLAIAADENDNSPKLFTSKPFYDDIKIAYKVNNPYFPIQSLIGVGSIIVVTLKEYFELFEKFEKLETETPVNVTKNIFLSDVETEKKFKDLSDKESKLSQYRTQLNDIEKTIVDLENDKDEETAPRRGAIQTKKGRNIRKKKREQFDVLIKKAKEERDSILILFQNLDKEIKELKEVKTTNTTGGLVSQKAVIDYEELVRFVDYMVNPAKFSVQEVENGNVKSANFLGKWEGEWIEKAKRRAAGETIELTIIDERIVNNVTEEEKPKTLVGKAIAAIEKIPVVGLVVKGVKAVVKFIGKLFSDERLKTNLVKVGEISGINIYTFRYKFDNRKLRMGVIAQEILNTPYKDYVTIDKETGYYVIDYNALQEKVDIVGEMKKIQSNINSKTGGFSNLFKAKILTPPPTIEFDNITGPTSDASLIKSKILGVRNPKTDANNLAENLNQSREKRKLFGTRNTTEQSEDSPKFLLKNRKAAKNISDSYGSEINTKFGFKNKPSETEDLGNFVLKRKGIKTKRD